MKNISRFPRVGMQILFAGFLIAILGGCMEKGAIQVTCPPGGGGVTAPGCTGNTAFPVPNTFNCITGNGSNICSNENNPCGPMNRYKCKTINDGTGVCNCSCM